MECGWNNDTFSTITWPRTERGWGAAQPQRPEILDPMISSEAATAGLRHSRAPGAGVKLRPCCSSQSGNARPAGGGDGQGAIYCDFSRKNFVPMLAGTVTEICAPLVTAG